MEYKFQCPYCFQKIQCNETNLNADCECPHCHEVFLLDSDFIALEELPNEPEEISNDSEEIHQNNSFIIHDNFKCNISLNEDKNMLRCPVCGSHNVHFIQRGYDVIRGLICSIFLPVIGLIFGFHGHTKLDCECINCYYKSSVYKFKKINLLDVDFTFSDFSVFCLFILYVIIFWISFFSIFNSIKTPNVKNGVALQYYYKNF